MTQMRKLKIYVYRGYEKLKILLQEFLDKDKDNVRDKIIVYIILELFTIINY